jgi:hypothetical protein
MNERAPNVMAKRSQSNGDSRNANGLWALPLERVDWSATTSERGAAESKRPTSFAASEDVAELLALVWSLVTAGAGLGAETWKFVLGEFPAAPPALDA